MARLARQSKITWWLVLRAVGKAISFVAISVALCGWALGVSRFLSWMYHVLVPHQ